MARGDAYGLMVGVEPFHSPALLTPQQPVAAASKVNRAQS